MKLRGPLRYLSFLNRRFDKQIKQKAEEDMKTMDSSLQFLQFKKNLRAQGQTIQKPKIQVNEINEKAKPLSTQNGVYLYTKPIKQTQLVSLYRRQAQREQFAAHFDKMVGVGGLFFLYKSTYNIYGYIVNATLPFFLPVHLAGVCMSAYYLLNKGNVSPFSEVQYNLQNNTLLFKAFGTSERLEVALENAEWERGESRAFYIIKVKNVRVKEENKESRVETQRVVYLYKNAHIDFELMHACFSSEVRQVEFTFN